MLKKIGAEKFLILVSSIVFAGVIGYDFFISRNKENTEIHDLNVEDEKSEQKGNPEEDTKNIEEPTVTYDKNIYNEEKNSNCKESSKKKIKSDDKKEIKQKDIKEFKKNQKANGKKVNKIININIATASEIAENLKGIGAVKAERIVLYRHENGNFSSIEEIKNVKGIGEKTFENIREQIVI